MKLLKYDRIYGLASSSVLIMGAMAAAQSTSAGSVQITISPPLAEQMAIEPEEPDMPKATQTLV